MTSFNEDLARLCSREMKSARDDEDRSAELVERLLNAAAFAVAIACKGDADAMAKMLEGSSSYLFEAAANHAPLGRLSAIVDQARRA